MMEDEYYSSVYSWFDKCGIISNIRTHLRQNLVNALKNRDLAQKLESSAPKSAKQYVYDLLIAEYLWNHNYVYTLSVLASEVPLLVNFNNHIRTNDGDNTTSNRQKLQSDYVTHTLETLGIKPTKTKGQSIIKEYAENDLPLLLCILQCVKSDDSLSTVNEKISEPWNVKHQEVQTKERGENVTREMLKIVAAKKKLFQQRDLFDTQLRQKEAELKEQTAVMEKQLLMLQEKLEQAQKIMQSYSIKEKQFEESKKQETLRIMQKETELTIQEKLLAQEAIRLEKERDSYRQFEGDLKKLQDELLKVQREIPQKERICNLSLKDVQVQTEFESFTVIRNERNILMQEKQDLNGLVREQQLRIDQLNSRVLHLSRKLEEVQLKRPQNADIPSSIIRVVNTTNTIVSESSSTDEMIKDAKMRLRRLEEESMKADQNYFSFITNSSQ